MNEQFNLQSSRTSLTKNVWLRSAVEACPLCTRTYQLVEKFIQLKYVGVFAVSERVRVYVTSHVPVKVLPRLSSQLIDLKLLRQMHQRQSRLGINPYFIVLVIILVVLEARKDIGG